MSPKQRYSIGDWVIYRKSKMSPQPGPRAAQIAPSASGETYAYVVDKFWVVVDTGENGDLVLQTRRGKRHELSAEDPGLRHANWLDRLRYSRRFQEVELAISNGSETDRNDEQDKS